jgi:hypothetical protein
VSGALKVLGRVETSDVLAISGEDDAYFFVAGLAIDADGAYRAYHPDSAQGLDSLRNAGHPGNWWALVTDTGKQTGNPVVQGNDDPAPGYYISKTALEDKSKASTDPTRYVDSETIPYIVLPGGHAFGARLGDLAVALRLDGGECCGAVYADVGPASKIGEGSIALADQLVVPSNPRSGGVSDGIAYVVFPGSRIGWPLTVDEIRTTAEQRFMDWGGPDRLRALVTPQ